MDSSVTLHPIGSGMTETVKLNGRPIGDVTTGYGSGASATMAGTRRFGSYRFASHADAVAAVVSYARHGHWTGEIG